jgi:hypothetical protein
MLELAMESQLNIKDYRAKIEAQIGSATKLSTRPPEDVWENALADLANPKSSAQKRENALRCLQAGTFLGYRFDPYRKRYVEALHRAIDHEDVAIRHFALDILIGQNDPVARQRLSDGPPNAATAASPIERDRAS